jgi:hypothetical protein
MPKPLMIDLFCGLGGWASGGLAEGYDVVGFDIEQHEYPERGVPEGDLKQPGVNWNRYKQTGGVEKSTPDWRRQATKWPLTERLARYPAQLVVQDVLTLHGSQFKDAALIVASPPCQEYSYMAMPWSRAKAKAKAAAIRADESGKMLEDLNRLFHACFRIQAQASIAAGRKIPMVVENVRGAQPWVGRARWNFGSFYLWGDVPALMPFTLARKTPGRSLEKGAAAKWGPHNMGKGDLMLAEVATRLSGQDLNRFKETGEVSPHWRMEALKVPGFRFDGSERSFQSASVEGQKVVTKAGAHGWFGADNSDHPLRASSAGSSARKQASAMIAKTPLPLSRHIARVYAP